MRWNRNHSEEWRLFGRWLGWKFQLSSDQFIAFLFQMLVEDYLVHGLRKFEIHFGQQGCSIRGALTPQCFRVLSHTQDSVHLVVINLRDLVSRHVFDVVVILN